MVRNEYYLDFIRTHPTNTDAEIAAHLGCDIKTVKRYKVKYLEQTPPQPRRAEEPKSRRAGCMPIPTCLKHIYQ